MKSTGHASWQGSLFEGSGVATLTSGAGGPFPVSWASRTEESAGKTSPEELIAAAHAACFSMALSNMLANAGNTADNLDTTAVATFEKTDAGMRITTMAITVVGTVPGMSADDFATHAAAAKDGCPVSNALKGNVNITVEASLA
jgi:osmotically inducible protein OsmC